MISNLWVDAPHYYAMIVIKDGVVTEAAPILRWTIGKTEAYVLGYFSRKGFKYGRLPDHGDANKDTLSRET